MTRDGIYKKRDRGYSFIELLVTIVIILILISAAIPTFSSWLPNHRLRSAAQDLFSNLQLAKMEAVKKKETTSIEFKVAEHKYIKADGSGVLLTRYKSGVSFGPGKATHGVDGESIGDGVTYDPDSKASFNSRGMGNNDGNVYLQNSRGTVYAIGSRFSGVIILRKWDNSEGKWK
jgi:prepilin-type N-terminal cleavage/methylation domain-containing protein